MRSFSSLFLIPQPLYAYLLTSYYLLTRGSCDSEKLIQKEILTIKKSVDYPHTPPRQNSERKTFLVFLYTRKFSSVPNMASWCLYNQSMHCKGKWYKAPFSPTVSFILSHHISLIHHTLSISVKLTSEIRTDNVPEQPPEVEFFTGWCL